MTLSRRTIHYVAISVAVLFHDQALAMDDLPDANPVRGEQFVQALGCADCHGEKGRGIQPGWPRLAGQFGQYLANQLDNFQSGRRPHPFMENYATILTQQDRQDIGRYYACQHPSHANDLDCGPVR